MLPKFSSRAFLAPMAGVSDPALRLQCKQMGAGLVVTEFTSIHSIIAKEEQLKENMKTIQEFIEFSEQERPISVQLFGSDLYALEKAATIVEPYFDIIDYNMGCPAPHITQQMAGGALLQEVNLTQQIFKTLVNAVKKPVTLKMRSGVTEASRFLFRDIAEIAEDEGIQMITFHPRTVSQGYSGNADWKLIKELKEISSVPIVGNGDITTPEDAKMMLDETNCDYVMIGRGAMGNPFLFEQINDYLKTGSYKEYSFKDRLDSFFDYLHLTNQYKIKFSNIKSQAMRFTKGLKGGSKLRAKITFSKNLKDLEKIMHDAYSMS
ncbi:putative tRNA-dihydrouridine synthase 1 protein [Marine Group I thaumarchaeote SCGC AAA799-N04]|uniref:Putative tRNA-dihydrouridine synthase 1 protein n=2 Tax=Marine Group I TaxID=905826 RepID=A0A081RLX6_9ARCH|nr:putative tRNA-dihydrouridine synthase 1 protein [Marine Group I thaumarchaeote SCGC AAA799-N04]KFM15124.1 putative tRNA-dihydrouridine synthase 1 protein [Marine Group I thaumarchaeote SCGC AAA799-D11]